MKIKAIVAGACGIVFAALIVAFVFVGCEMEVIKETTDAATPVIEIDGDTFKNQAVYHPTGYVELSIAASVGDGGVLTYQWYRYEGAVGTGDGTPVADETATTATLQTPAPEPGVYYYYIVVTNTNDSVNGAKVVSARSDIVAIVVNVMDEVEYPLITGHPKGGTSIAGDEIELAVEFTPPEDEDTVITYQWYSSNTYSSSGGDRVDGATEATFSLTLQTAGTYYFYVVVTYTLDEDSKSAVSLPATVVIVAEMTPNATLALNPNMKFQYVRGFGGMDIPWDNFFAITEEEYEKMYNPDTGLGYNIMRIMIMPENPEDNTDPDKTIDYYLTEGGRPDYINGVQIVNKYNGYVLASPWSPPPEWKSNGTVNGGGYLIKDYWGAYAQYLRDYCQAMYNRGAPIYAVSIQNEPNFTATYDGCEWENNDMRDFFIQQKHFTTEPEAIPGYGGGKATPWVLTMNGESANNPNINNPALNSTQSRPHIDLIGRHIYGNVQSRYAAALDHATDPKEVWMTEHNINSGSAISYPNDSTWNYVWPFMNEVDVSIRLNDESAFIWWALKRFYSFIGDGADAGKTVEGVILPRGYALSHYAKFAKETRRIAVAAKPGSTTADGTELTSTGNAVNFNNGTFAVGSTAVKVSAFMSEDGNSISLVMFTPTNTSGGGGVDMGTIQIDMPAGFTIGTATAMRSTAAFKAKSEEVLLSSNKQSAYIALPPSNIVSVRFTK